MSVRDIVIALLLFGAGAVEISCALALLVVKDSFDRLHFLGPAATLGPLLVVTALVVENSLSTNGVKAILTGGLLLLTGASTSTTCAGAADVFGQQPSYSLSVPSRSQGCGRSAPTLGRR